MQVLYFVLIAFVTVYIYRLGLKDGQRVSEGEKITDKPIKLFKGHKETKTERGLKNIIANGMGDKI